MRSFKRFLSLFLAIYILLALAGCGKSGSDAKDYGSLKIGIIYTDDYKKSFNYAYAFDQGLIKTCKDLGIADSQVIRLNITKNYKDEILSLIERSCNVIITTDIAIIDSLVTEKKDSLKELIEQNKKVTFLNYGYTDYKLTNQSSFYAKTYEATYLAGIAAGMKTKSNAVAYFPTYGTTDSLSTSMADAFSVGIYSVNAAAKVYVSYLNTNMDLVLETSKTKGLIDKYKCDVVLHSLYTELCPNAAEAEGVPFITYNGIGVTDLTKMEMFSVNVDWSVFFTSQFKSIVGDSFTSAHKMLGLSDGTVTISTPDKNNCSKEITDAVNAAKDKIIKGELNIFAKVIYDSEGRTLVAASGKDQYTDDDLINHFDRYNFNITEAL